MMAVVFFLCIKGILVPCKLINSGKKTLKQRLKSLCGISQVKQKARTTFKSFPSCLQHISFYRKSLGVKAKRERKNVLLLDLSFSLPWY